MKNAVKIDVSSGIVILNDGSIKTIDNYILELEDKIICLQELLNKYEPDEIRK